MADSFSNEWRGLSGIETLRYAKPNSIDIKCVFNGFVAKCAAVVMVYLEQIL
jgi:hypothetical protein